MALSCARIENHHEELVSLTNERHFSRPRQMFDRELMNLAETLMMINGSVKCCSLPNKANNIFEFGSEIRKARFIHRIPLSASKRHGSVRFKDEIRHDL